MIATHSLSVQRSCRCVGLSRSAFYKTPQNDSERDADVIHVLSEMVARHARWGFWKCFRAMRRLGHSWNHKRVYRVYCELRLNQKRRAKKRLPKCERQPLLARYLTYSYRNLTSEQGFAIFGYPYKVKLDVKLRVRCCTIMFHPTNILKFSPGRRGILYPKVRH